MPLKFKIDILEALKAKGYSSYRLRKEKILSESTMQLFRKGETNSFELLSRLCQLLDCQPGDILEYVPDDIPKD